MKREQVKREVSRRLDALVAATRLDRARCIGMLDAEYAERFRLEKLALDELFESTRDEREQKAGMR